MNWAYLRAFPWVDTRAGFVAGIPRAGRLLDIGSSDGETLGHFAELRPDLQLFAVDKEGRPERYPANCRFQRVDVERERLACADRSMDAITCMHLIEHLNHLDLLFEEVARVLKPGAKAYFETPHPRTVHLPTLRGSAAGTFTMNFFDDPTHVRPVAAEALAASVTAVKLEVAGSGISRNWLFAAMHPVFMFLPASRKKFTARVHWIGWSSYLIACRPE